MSYYAFKDEEGGEYGSFEVFFCDEETMKENADADDGPDFWWTEEDVCPTCGGDMRKPKGIGWYWWACFPGCLPDSEPHGPFENEKVAYDNAQEDA